MSTHVSRERSHVLLRAFASLSLVTALAACGGGSSSDETPPPAPAPTEGSATIDSTGGTVTGPDGVLLQVPEGAVTEATTFRIAKDGSNAPELGGVKVLGSVYSITPHGTQFISSAHISLPYDASKVTAGTQPMILKAQPGGAWMALPSTTVDGKVGAVDTPSLSFYAVGTCYTTADVNIPGPDPIWACPAAHSLKAMLHTADNTEVPVPRTPSGLALPALTITTPTNLMPGTRWQRPAGAGPRTDHVTLWLLGAGLTDAQQPIPDLAIDETIYSTSRAFTLDPATVPGAGGPNGTIVRLSATASYTGSAFYPGCLCFKPATWTFQAEVPIRVKHVGPVFAITQQPQSRTVTAGQPATFTVAATGPGTLSYQWRNVVNGVATPIAAATTASYVNSTALGGDVLGFNAEVCSQVGSAAKQCLVSDTATLTVVAAPIAPVFTVQPGSITVTAGETVTLNATATGLPAPTVSWTRVDGGAPVAVCAPVTGTASTTVTSCALGPQALASTGAQYRATAVNTAATTLSTVATVTVMSAAVAPTLTSAGELADRTVAIGGSTSWTVAATGTAPISYAWNTVRSDNTRVAGVECPGGNPMQSITGDTLSISNVPAGCDGVRIEVVVSNAVGTASPAARIATLTVPATGTTPDIPPGSARLLSGMGDTTCGVTASGGLLCWGSNAESALGTGSGAAFAATPTAVASLANVTQVSAGVGGTCAVHDAGLASCWGSFTSIGSSTTPLRLSGIADAYRVYADTSSWCVIRSDRRLYCNDFSGAAAAVQADGSAISNLEEVIKTPDGLCVRQNHDLLNCFRLDASHALSSFLSAPGYASLGVSSGLAVAECSSQNYSLPGRIILCAGSNQYGQYGLGNTDSSAGDTVPVVDDAAAVAVGTRHACSLLGDGRVMCWGTGYMGNGAGEQVAASPAIVQGLDAVVAISAGRDVSCALRSDGQVLCWGANDKGQVGNGTSGSPVLVPTPTAAGAVFAH